MTKRWLIRISGGVAALAVSAALATPIAYLSVSNWKANTIVPACTCSPACGEGKHCCSTGPGCGCFPDSIQC